MIICRQEIAEGGRDALRCEGFRDAGRHGRIQRDAPEKPLHALPGVRDKHEQAVGPPRGDARRGEDGHPGVRRTEAPLRLGVERDAPARVLFREPRRQGRPRSGLEARESGRCGVRQRREVGSRFPGRGRDAWGRLGHPLPGQGGRPPVQPVGQRARRRASGRGGSATCHGRVRTRLHGRLRAEAGRLHRGVFPERELEGGRGPADPEAVSTLGSRAPCADRFRRAIAAGYPAQ